MQTSLIVYPQADRFVIIRESILYACKGDRTAAALISFLEYWHNWRNQQIEYTAIMNEMLANGQEPPILDLSGWQYHTDEQLERGILISKVDTIRKSIDFLENDLRFISTEVPDRLRMIHKTGRTKWFLLMAGRINEWLSDYAKQRGRTLKPIPNRISHRSMETLKGNSEIETVFNYRNRRREEYWKKRGKTVASPKASVKIYKLIEDRLKEGHSVIDLCMAIEGNLWSDWHQGANDRKRIYDTFDLIFRNSEKVEQFATMAHQAGISKDQIEAAALGEVLDPHQVTQDNKAISYLIATTLAPLVIHLPVDTDSVFDPILQTSQLPIDLDFDLIERLVSEIVEAEVGMFTESHRNNLIDLFNQLNETI